MSANYEAASAEGEISCGFLNFIFNNEAASSSYGDIITNSYQDAIMKKEAAAEEEISFGCLNFISNYEAASISNGAETITISDQDARIKNKPAAEAASIRNGVEIITKFLRDALMKVAASAEDPRKRSEAFKEELREIKDSHLIVAALIATVTFTAAFTLPGGVIQDGDKDEGTAILSKKLAFQVFVITDAIALVLSLSAVFAHFLASLLRGENTSKKINFLVMYGAYSTLMAMGAMVIAFVTGTYAVLTTSLGLATLTTFIGLSFFLLMFLIWRKVNEIRAEDEE